MAIPMTIAVVMGLVPLLLFVLWSSRRPTSLRLPPGPRPLPIVGNLLLIKKYPSVQDFANELKRKYGPIVTLWMGSKPIVIVSGPEIIHEAMITQGSIFMGRNRLPSTRFVTSDNRTLFSGHGERHRFLRKLVVSEILSNKRIAGFSAVRKQEVNILIELLEKQVSDSPGIVADFRSAVRLAVCNLLVSLVFGRRLTSEESVEINDVMLQRLQMGAGKPRDFIPLLAWLPDKKDEKAQLQLLEKTSQIFQSLIEERKQILRSGKSEQATFLDSLLGLQSGEIKSSIEISDSDVVALCLELLVAGTDTTALNLEYCIANLINHPEIQEKLAQEINSAVVGDRLFDEDDIPQLPYLQAVVKEALRRHSPARLSPARRALSSTKLAGYDIPENTTVLQHLEAVALSPEIWEDPLEFRPERFVNKNVDITGTTEVSLIPFGVGRRICPGINIALLHAQLILARLVQAFEWRPATPGQHLDLSPTGGPSGSMKYPLAASVQKRSRVR